MAADDHHSWRYPPSCALLLEYLSTVSSLIVVVLTEEGLIRDFNRRAEKILKLPEDARGRDLQNFVEIPSLDGMADDDGHRSLRLHLRNEQNSLETLDGFVSRDDEGFVLIGESLQINTEEVVTGISRLNSQMADLLRVLRSKNRELTMANRTITRLMKTDDLTGLANRRSFTEAVRVAMENARTNDSPLSLVLADLDHFKRINDTFGHDKGDEVLKTFARFLRAAVRDEDVASRWGGEEFALVLRTDLDGALSVTERVRQELKTQKFFGSEEQITASFGVSLFKGREQLDTWFRRTDQALYRAKEAGRDRIEISDESPDKEDP